MLDHIKGFEEYSVSSCVNRGWTKYLIKSIQYPLVTVCMFIFYTCCVCHYTYRWLGWALWIWARHTTRTKLKGLAQRLHWTTKSKEDVQLWCFCKKQTAWQRPGGRSIIFLWRRDVRFWISKGVKAMRSNDLPQVYWASCCFLIKHSFVCVCVFFFNTI